jgi:DNA-directed RNA polymerase alpha subunit
VGELISRGERELLSLRNFGQKSKQELEERLNTWGLSLTPQVGEEGAQTEQVSDSDTYAEGSEETDKNQPQE